MAMSFDTGAVEDRACIDCGALVRHCEHVTYANREPVTWWSPKKHEAPCGLPCLGGGVSPKDYRAKRVHSMSASPDGKARSCVNCGNWTREEP